MIWVPILVLLLAGIAVLVSMLSRQPAHESPSRVESLLGWAIRARDLASVEKLLSEGADPNAAAHDDLPALHTATLCGAAALIEPLIAAGAAIDHADPVAGGVVSCAIASGETELAVVLLDAGAPVDALNEGGAHALHVAALLGHVPLVRRLVADGLDVDRPNDQGGTALRSAASAGKRDAVVALLELGADPGVVDDMGKRPIDYARDGSHLAVMTLLSRAARPSREPHERAVGAPLGMLLPGRHDATLGLVRQGLEQGWSFLECATSSLEAPSLVWSVQRALAASFSVPPIAIDDPDPRLPVRDVRWTLWTYPDDGIDPQPVLAEPPREVSAEVRALAIRPYALRSWSAHAKEVAARSHGADVAPFLATMARPPNGPSYLDAWDWWFRVQVAAALVVSHLGSEDWLRSARRDALLDVLDGPADWSNTAAIVALVDVARRDSSAREDVLASLAAVTRRKVTAPAYQHAIQPAARALIELGDVPADTRAGLAALALGR